jgi:muramoyltetrapeptide carboxypeptidase
MMLNTLMYCLLMVLNSGSNKTLMERSKTASFTAHKSLEMIRPSYLKPGDTVAVLAPAGVLKQDAVVIQKTKTLLNSWGLEVVFGDQLQTKSNHFAGTDAQRSCDFQNALDNPNIKAIWCARGGYGTLRIIDDLDFTEFKAHPKWIVGYSDVTVLHSALNTLGYESLHAMMCINLTDDASAIKHSVETLKSALFGTLESYEIEGNLDNRPGNATGPLVGGNLSLLTAILGSDTSLDTTGKIIFIEEIGEYKYHIDRQLQSLKRAGYFKHCAGVIIGDMCQLKTNNPAWGQSIEALILDVLKDTNVPVAFGFPAGHEFENRALYLGRKIQLHVTKSKTRVLFVE